MIADHQQTQCREWESMKARHKVSQYRLTITTWILISLTIALVSVWLGSGFCSVSFGDGATYDVRLNSGFVGVAWAGKPRNTDRARDAFAEELTLDIHSFRLSLSPMHCSRLPNKTAVGINLYCPVALILAVTLALFKRHAPHKPPSHCQSCGYNLTGNISGRCPECGFRKDQVSS